jgi:hypothetical protein
LLGGLGAAGRQGAWQVFAPGILTAVAEGSVVGGSGGQPKVEKRQGDRKACVTVKVAIGACQTGIRFRDTQLGNDCLLDSPPRRPQSWRRRRTLDDLDLERRHPLCQRSSARALSTPYLLLTNAAPLGVPFK